MNAKPVTYTRQNRKKTILLNPGPVNTSPRVQKALLKGDLCHREVECFQLLEDIREKLLQAFVPTGKFTAVLITGSGTAALESAVCSSVTPGKKLLIVNNGVYGDRIVTMARAFRVLHLELKSSWLGPPDLQKMETLLSADPGIEGIAMVHHETTTGLINPVEQVGSLSKRHRKFFLVDAISSLGGEDIDLNKNNISLCVGTANKCIQGFPGMSFVLLRRDQVERVLNLPARSVYLALSTYLKESPLPVPFTPAVQIAYAFREALSELLNEGTAQRIARLQKASMLLREGFAKLNLRFVLPPHLRSNTITALYLPNGLTYDFLHDRLRTKGYTIYGGQGKLQSEIFRIANMGHLTSSDFKGFLKVLTAVLKGAQ